MPSAEIGSILVNVLANTATFARDMERANKKLDSFGKVAKTVTKLSVGMFAGFSAARFIDQTAKSIDSLGKVSDKLNVATERMQELRYAAELTAGVANQQFDTALQRMTRRISEAASGTGEAIKALEELGLSASYLNRLSPDQSFLEIADAMRQIENESDQVRLAFKLFDTEGVALVNTLREGSASIEALAGNFRSLGASLSRDQVRKIEQANDAFKNLTIAVSAIGQSFLVEFAPEIKLIADNIAKYLIPTLKSAKQFFIALGQSAASAFSFFTGDLEASKALAEAATRSFTKGVEEIKKFGKEINNIQGPKKIDLTGLFSAPSGELPIYEQLEKTRQKVLQMQKEAKLSKGETLLSESLGSAAMVEAETELAAQKVAAYYQKVKELSEMHAETMRSIWENIGRGIGDAFADALVDGKNFMESLQILGRQVLKEVISGLVQVQIAKATFAAQSMAAENAATANTVRNQTAIAAAAAPAAGATSLSTFGANSIPAIAGIAAVFALVFSLTKRAVGGPLGMNQPALVGEHGPELFIPQTAGKVIPNSQLSGGGTTINLTVIRAIDARSFRDLLRRNGATINEVSIQKQNERGNTPIFRRR